MTDTTGRTYRMLLALSCALALVAMCFAGGYRWMAPLTCACLLSLVLAAPGYPALRKWCFTIWIAAGVSIGMSYPSWFIGIGDFKFTRLFVPILQIIMFGMGTTQSIDDFLRVLRLPLAVLVGTVCHFIIMPLVGLGLAVGFGFPPEIGAGLVLVGSVSTGLASNVMAYIAKANVALSVTMTAVSTTLAPVLTPLLMKTIASQLIEIDAVQMMWDLIKMVLIPVIGGMVFHHLFYHRAAWLNRMMPVISMVGIIVLTVLTVAVGRDNLLRSGAWLVPACFLHSTVGYGLGYLIARAFRMNENNSRSIAFAVGMQNAGLAAGIAAQLNQVSTLGLAPIVFGPIMNTAASVLANWWRTHPPRVAMDEL